MDSVTPLKSMIDAQTKEVMEPLPL